jgi:hypothetical protein
MKCVILADSDLQDGKKEAKTIFVQDDLTFTMSCHADASLSYCWFLHPNGTQFSPVAHTSDEQLFWFVLFVIIYYIHHEDK